MNISELQECLKNCEIAGEKIIINNNIRETIESLAKTYHYDLLKSITAVDNGDNIELIYHLFSTEDEEDLIISVYTKDEAETISDLFESAKQDENEIYDMFGIKFTGNKDLKRLYMPEEWIGHPLRKDYVENDTRLAWNDENNA